jgi:Spy/CpxP family protein refolding chaperone
MMSRKYTTILTTMIISLLAVGAALAQDTGEGDSQRNHDGERRDGMSHRGSRGSMDPERLIGMMSRRLDLDDTQTEQVSNIYLAAKPELEAWRGTGRTNRMAMRDLNSEDADYEVTKQGLSAEREGIMATGKELRDRIRAEIDAILTPEQREEYAAMAERGRDRGQRRRNPDGAKPEA